MKLACNYYLETEKLFDEGIISLDYFKYPALGFQMDIMRDLDAFELFCGKLAVKRPILLHGLYPAPHDLASPDFQADFNAGDINRLLKMTKTPGISIHAMLSKLPEDVPFAKIFGTIIKNAAFLKEKYADMEFVAIENFDHIDRYGDLIKPEIITELLNETGCDFVLDVSHAYYASRGLRIDLYDYLRKLPLEKVVEIHINGWIENENGRMCHTIIHEEAYQALREVLLHCKPKIITVEYGRLDDQINSGCPVMSPDKINDDAKKEIIEQIIKIKEMVHG
jgi:uncharacterized protein (UPF0276 family)